MVASVSSVTIVMIGCLCGALTPDTTPEATLQALAMLRLGELYKLVSESAGFRNRGGLASDGFGGCRR